MTLDLIQKLQSHPERIFNFTICAHIDHGKTSLSDSLLASNDLVNQQQAGELRSLDFLPLEQQRGITLKSSVVSLISVSQRFEKPFPALFHLFDSPGHCDFQSEVLQALALSDSALLLVDIVESVSSQTRAIIQMLKTLDINIVLGLNKVDRLFEELKMTSTDIYNRVLEVIAEVNEEYGEEYFSFSKNVIICSGIQKWGFDCYRAAQISQILAPQLKNMDFQTLIQQLALPNTVLTENGTKQGQGPCIMSHILDLITTAYKKPQKVAKLCKKLNLTLPQSMKEENISPWFLQNLFNLSQTVFDQIISSHKQNQPNKYVQQLLKMDELDACLSGVKHLNRQEIDIQDSNDQFFAIVRVVKNPSLQLQLDKEFYTDNGKLVKIINIYQPFGKFIRLTQTNKFCENCLLVIGTEELIPSNSILYQIFDKNIEQQEDELEILTSQCLKARNSIKIIQNDQVSFIQEKIMDLNQTLLKYQKPLITVTLNTELFSQFGQLYQILQNYANYDQSCTFNVSSQGELQLSVCGDVHLDLCIANIQQLSKNIRFDISDSSFKINEIPIKATKNSYLKRYLKLEETLLEYQHQIHSNLFDDNCKRLQYVKNLPFLSNHLDFFPNYFQFIGDQSVNEMKNLVNIQGVELIIQIQEIQQTITINKVILEAFVLPSTQEYLNDQFFEFYRDQRNNVLFVDQSISEALQLIIKHAFISNMNTGPLCLEQMSDVSLFLYTKETKEFQCVNDDADQLYNIIQSNYPNYFLSLRQSSSSAFDTISLFVRQTISQSNLRVSEPHLQTLVTTPLNCQQSTLQVLQKFNAKQINFQSYTTKSIQIESFIPIRFGLTFPRELRSAASGQAEVDFTSIQNILLEEDPRRGIIDEDAEVEWGIQGKGLNEAEMVVVEILSKKGLIVEDFVEDGEKQRTIAKKR